MRLLPLPVPVLALTRAHHHRHHLRMSSFSSSSPRLEPPTHSVLLVSSSADSASVNLATALSTTLTWTQPVAACPSLYQGVDEALNCRLYLWRQDQPLLHLDEPHEHVEHMLLDHAVVFDEVLFLSKHSAASGKASLTAHPIGIPWMSDAGLYGGKPGKCSPPSPRIASLYRALVAKAAINKAGGGLPFDVTMEATHHGPHVSLPTAFIEIGSTENEWEVPELGQFWADLLLEHFTTPLAVPRKASDGGIVAMSIGGGHYVPKLNDVARFGEGMHTGHALASYTLQGYFDGTVGVPVEGGWQAVVTEAVASTRAAHPTARCVVVLDKKAFGAENRRAIVALLEGLGVEWTHNVSDVRKMYDDWLSASTADPASASASASASATLVEVGGSEGR